MLCFRRIEPSAALRPYVTGFWMVENPANMPVALGLVPDGYPELVFPLEEPLELVLNGEPVGCAGPGLIGQLHHSIVLQAPAHGRWLFVKLFPTTAFQLFGVPMCRLNDRLMEVEALSASLALRQLGRDVQSSGSFEHGVRLIESYLLLRLSRLPAGSDASAFLQMALHTIFRRMGTGAIGELNRPVRASLRHLEMQFRQCVGLSPKYYARLIRVKKASMALLGDPGPGSIGMVADQLGYFDPSHFLKDFKGITRQSPSAFVVAHQLFPLRQKQAYLEQWDYS